MSDKSKILGLIAGSGQFPLMVADAAKKRDLCVVAVAHRDETDSRLAHMVNQIVWIELGQVGKLIKAFKENGVRKALMAGAIAKKRMFEKISPDSRGLELMSKVAVFHDDSVLRALAAELAEEGIEIVSSTLCLPELLAPQGCLTIKKPNKAESADILFGWKVAKEIGHMDIGQCSVVRRKTVLAVEAMEGTDEMIARAGRMCRAGGWTLIKVSKPNQDMRFDVPTIGKQTIENLKKNKAACVVLEAGKTLIIDMPETIKLAEENKIVVLGHKS